MALFQNAVLNKYLSGVDEKKVEEAWEKFTDHFHNTEVQENIRNSKEEAYQEGFLEDLFVKVLGYTKNPSPDYNLMVEQKNLTDSKKSDGALLDGEKVRGVIELKGTETTDLGKVETQAFGYKNKQPDAIYVIISNFEKLRFYIDNAVDFLEFNLFRLTKEEFKVLWLCLGYPNFAKGLPKKIKDASLTEEENITKKLYKDYSDFKNAVFESMKEHNPEYDKLLLFKKTQKLLDRFLFIFFAEDRLLLPPNSIREIIRQWMDLRDKYDEYVPLYDRFKKYFGYMNEGHKGKNHEIFAYNGGLFAEDEVLHNLNIEDEILYKYASELSKYDFESEVDVNILGHIFEHSLNEIEEINAELKGEKVDRSKTRRKKDGVFYTPKYITKYIVEHTVGKLCEEKKAGLDIVDERFTEAGRRSQKGISDLKTYREWLLDLTICDPACGSGAFLNQALEFLIAEHKYIDELQAKYHGEALVLSDIEDQILENNLFGVDINEESVEIAKLSLWLRTAQKGRKLTSLNNHIKCGNSLIDDPEVAGEKAFKWEEEFPDVFADGGFDVVIGNPPYGAHVTKEQKTFYKENYSITEYNYDTYKFFYELSLRILKEGKLLGFITPNTFIVIENGTKLRNLLFIENTLVELYETFNVFSDAVVEPINIIVRKSEPDLKNSFYVLTEKRKDRSIKKTHFEYSHIQHNDSLIFNYRESPEERKLFQKIENQSVQLSECANVTTGIKPYQTGKGKPKQTREVVKEKPFTSYEYSKGWNPLVRGTQINRYQIKWDSEYIKYGEWLAEPRDSEIFFNPKLFIRRTDDRLMSAYDEDNFIGLNSIHCIQSKDESIPNKYLMVLINSKLINWYFQHQNFHMVGKPFAEIKVVFVERLPIKPSQNSEEMISLSDKITDLYSSLNKLIDAQSQFFKSKFDIEKLSRKLQSWHELTFKQFLKELKKKKVKLSLEEEAEWMEYFNEQKAEAEELKDQIAQTDMEIDTMVYELYGLNEEEVEVVEGS